MTAASRLSQTETLTRDTIPKVRVYIWHILLMSNVTYDNGEKTLKMLNDQVVIIGNTISIKLVIQ